MFSCSSEWGACDVGTVLVVLYPFCLPFVGERSMTKDYLLSVVRRILEELVNNRPVDHLEKCGFFCDV